MCRSEEKSHFVLISVRIQTWLALPACASAILTFIFDNSSYSLHFKGCFFRAKHRFHFLRESDPLSLYCINRLSSAKILCVVLILHTTFTPFFLHAPHLRTHKQNLQHLLLYPQDIAPHLPHDSHSQDHPTISDLKTIPILKIIPALQNLLFALSTIPYTCDNLYLFHAFSSTFTARIT